MYKFVDTHFSKIFDVAWMDNFNEGIDNGDGGADIGNKKKQMVEPRCEQEQRLVTEILNLAGIFVKVTRTLKNLKEVKLKSSLN
jgi:hypothetical protein